MSDLDYLNQNTISGEIQLLNWINAIKKKYNASEVDELFGSINSWGQLNLRNIERFNAGDLGYFDGDELGKVKEESKKAVEIEKKIKSIITEEEFEGFKKIPITGVVREMGPSMNGLAEKAYFAHTRLEKYEGLVQSAIESASDKDAKRTEVIGTLRAIIQVDETRKNDKDFWQFQKGYDTQIENKEKAFILALSDTPGFDSKMFEHYIWDANQFEGNNAEFAKQLLDRVENADVYLAAKNKVRIPGAEMLPVEKEKSEKAIKGIFGIDTEHFKDDGDQAKFYVSGKDDSPIKEGDIIEFDVNGKKIKAIAVGIDGEMIEGVAGNLSPKLAAELGVTEDDQAELTYKVVNKAAAGKFAEVAEQLLHDNGWVPKEEAKKNEGQLAGAESLAEKKDKEQKAGDITAKPGSDNKEGGDKGTVAKANTQPVPRKIDLSAVDGLVTDLNNGARDDFRAMHDRIAQLEQIPELKAEVDRLKLAIQKTNETQNISLRGDRETHVISTGASRIIMDVNNAGKTDGSLDIADAKRVLAATAEAVEQNTIASDSNEVHGQMLEAIAQAKAQGADATNIMSIADAGGANPQNLMANNGAARTPGG